MAISKDAFRHALGHFATGVTVITVVRSPGQVHGMTANAFASVSLDPPLVLVCVEHAARSFPLLREQRRFGVNVLREGQLALARYFADTTQDHETAQHLGVCYETSERGIPLLADCLARLECALVATHQAGDHTIFVAEVEEASVSEGRPLLFYRGKFPGLERESC